MDEYINESAETQEVAEPETDVAESAESQEVAEPEPETTNQPEENRKTESDAAFAEMRRANQQLEREKQQMMAALSRYFDGDTPEDLSINAMAYADQRDPEEYRAEWEHDQEFEQLKAYKEQLEKELFDMHVDRLMRDGLRDIQAIDPNVKSLDDLGENFAKFISAGLTSTEAYWASKAQQMKEKVLAPSAIGRVSETKAERDFYTSEELDRLTSEDLKDDAVFEKAMRSLERLNKR